MTCIVEILTEHDLRVFARGEADASTRERVMAGLREDPKVGEILQRLEYEMGTDERAAAE